jgi:hypothetical protein
MTDRATMWCLPVDIYRVDETHMKDKKDLAILKVFFSLSHYPIFLHCNLRFSLAYKRGSRAPHEVEWINPSRTDQAEP